MILMVVSVSACPCLQVENVRMIDRYNAKNPVVGNLYVTTTHLIFAYPESNKETWVSGVATDSIYNLY